MSKFIDEQQLLDETFRKDVIREIVESEENLSRKADALRRHEIAIEDKNKKWVMLGVEQEGYKPETVAQIRNRATNISIAGKIVDKKAKSYVGGVERKVVDQKAKPGAETGPVQQSLDKLVELLDANSRFKEWDRYREIQRNTLLQVLPVPSLEETTTQGVPRQRITLRPYAPWQYDVIEHPRDKTQPAVVILSEFTARANFPRNDTNGALGIRSAGSPTSQLLSDGKDQVIADSQEDTQIDPKDRRYIWWSNNLHFTTDYQGRIVSEGPPVNPIKLLPFVNLCGKQNGDYFWASGGDDIADGSILINKMLTDVNFISWVQGWGQMVIAAKDIPKKLLGGPDNAFLFEKSDPAESVQVFFATSNPPIEKHLENARSQLAMLLSTNGLASRTIATKLDVSTAPSGIALMVEDLDLVVECKDTQELLKDAEPKVWKRVFLWHSLYKSKDWLVRDQQEVEAIPPETLVATKFTDAKPPITEKEKIDTIKAKLDAGLCTRVDALRLDNPDLSEEQAREKAEEIENEKASRAAAFGLGAQPKPGEEPGKGDGENENDNEPPPKPEEVDDNEEDQNP